MNGFVIDADANGARKPIHLRGSRLGSGFHQMFPSELIQFGGRHPAARGSGHLVQRLSNNAPNDFQLLKLRFRLDRH